MSAPTPPPPAIPAGWYNDPEVPMMMRWWDGVAWTEHRQPVVPPPAAGAQQHRAGASGIVCPHCFSSGTVKKTLLGSRREHVNFARTRKVVTLKCSNCGMQWEVR